MKQRLVSRKISPEFDNTLETVYDKIRNYTGLNNLPKSQAQKILSKDIEKKIYPKYSKKGFLPDLITWLVLFFVAVILIVIIFIGFKSIKPAMVNNDIFNATEESSKVMPRIESMYDFSDTLLVYIFFFSFISLIITAFLIRIHPIFIIPAIFFLIIMIILSFIMANAYSDLQRSSPIVANYTSTSFTKTSFIMDKLPFFVIPVAVIFIIILLSKWIYGQDGM